MTPEVDDETPAPAPPGRDAGGPGAPGPGVHGRDAPHRPAAGRASPPGTVGDGGAETDAPAAAPEDPLTVAARQRDEYLDMLRRVQADFENYKKRTLRQQSDQLERASENLVAKLLPALDAFDLTRAHLAGGDDVTPEVKALLQAAALVDDALAKEGLERIDDAGAAFDPTVHDAVDHAPADDTADAAGEDDDANGTVAGPVVDGVLRTGYRWKGRVLRPAMVRVRG